MKRDLSKFELYLIIDRSGSMDEAVKKGTKLSRWEMMQESAISAIKKMCEFDSSGVDVIFFANTVKHHSNIKEKEQVKELFEKYEPAGGTMLIPALNCAFNLFNTQYKGDNPKKGIIVICTDGEANDGQKEIAKVIIDQTQVLETDSDLTILILQVGDDPKATAFLQKLDDSLEGAGAKFDIVDVMDIQNIGEKPFAEVLVSAIEG